MAQYDRIETETETHRLEKAVAGLVSGAALPLKSGTVAIEIDPTLVSTPCAQHLLCMLVHLLARMKGIVRTMVLRFAADVPLHPGIPLVGTSLTSGLEQLVGSLSGPQSTYRTELVIGSAGPARELQVRIGSGSGDVVVGADAWRALLGKFVDQSSWSDGCPLGPYMAATLAAAEVFKRLLRINFDWQEGALLDDVAYSLFDYSLNEKAAPGPDLREIALSNLAIAGAGAGGTAALYTLCSFPAVSGSLVAVEPGKLKESNLGRYLMSDYDQVHSYLHKLDSVKRFLEVHAPKLHCEGLKAPWHQVPRAWQTVLATVDTPEARWDVQRSRPVTILEAGVIGLLYGVLRVIPGGWCLECKHPPDPELTWKRRALRWGVGIEAIKQKYYAQAPVTREDIERLAHVQNRAANEFQPLIGVPFDQVPALTECGETALSLGVPSQAPVLPMSTTAAGIVLAAEVVKDLTGRGAPLHNYLVHDLRFRLRSDCQKYKPRNQHCQSGTHD